MANNKDWIEFTLWMLVNTPTLRSTTPVVSNVDDLENYDVTTLLIYGDHEGHTGRECEASGMQLA